MQLGQPTYYFLDPDAYKAEDLTQRKSDIFCSSRPMVGDEVSLRGHEDDERRVYKIKAVRHSVCLAKPERSGYLALIAEE